MELGKRIIFTALVFILFTVNVHTVSAQTVTMSLSPESENVDEGETFTLSVILGPENSNVYGVQFDLLFDKTIIEGVRVEKGPLLESDGSSILEGAKTIDNNNGKMSYSIARRDVGNGTNSSGIVAYITFRGVNIGLTAINFENVIVNDPLLVQIPTAVIDGSVNVTEAPPSPQETEQGVMPSEIEEDNESNSPSLDEDETLELTNSNNTILVLSSELSEVSEGDGFIVNIYIKSMEPIYGVEFKLSYDKNLVEGVSMEQGSFLGGSVIVNDINNDIGEMMYAETRIGNVTGIESKGIIAKAGFKARNPGNITIQPENIRFVNDNEGIIDGVLFSDLNITINELPESRKGNAAGILGTIIIVLISVFIAKIRKGNR